MIAEKTAAFRFSGHQTFAFRYGWLKKGVDAVRRHGEAFAQPDALVQLGVGKNMVESIRHWCLATQMVEEVKKDGKRVCSVTEPGRSLLLDGGWDPYLEDDASLWLIHWLLVTNPQLITTWQIIFGAFHRAEMTKRELVDFVADYAQKRGAKTRESTLAKDVDCFLRTYTLLRPTRKGAVAEDSFDCPLQELGLIQASPDGELYRFAIGPKPTLPVAVFGYALEHYFTRVRGGSKSLSVQECVYGPGSPGQAFKLDEDSLIECVEDLGRLTRGRIAFSDTAGLKLIYRKQSIGHEQLLSRYFAEARD